MLRLVTEAYDGLPSHQWPRAPEFLIELRLLPSVRGHAYAEPPPLQTHEMSGALCGVIDAFNHAVVMPERRRALIVASGDLLAHAQHLRQELIEFAVFILAARGQRLAPLHAACIGIGGRGVLLLGDSGSGKSTLALHAYLRGLELLSEDAVFVRPDTMFATGVANYLRVRVDAPHFGKDRNIRCWIRGSPVIRRNSGARKFEVDLRQGPGGLAPGPLQVCAAVFVSDEPARNPRALLEPLPAAEAEALLCAGQTYAATQPGWDRFMQRIRHLGTYRLRRGDPDASVAALRRLLD